jgi:hypothetical protein
MAWWGRRLPRELRPGLMPEERVVAWARVPGAGGADAGGAVVATNLGVFLPGRAARLGWHEIHKAAWTGRELVFIPAEVVEEGAGYLVTRDGPAVSVAVPEPGDLPERVRARVLRSVSYSAHERLPGGGGVRVVARRVPGVDGLAWAVRYDAGTDPRAPGVAEATAELVRATEPFAPAYG